MKPGKHPRRRSRWISRRAMADVLGVSPPVLTQTYEPLFPKNAIRRLAGRVEFDGRRCLEAWASATFAPIDGDPLLEGGGSSPALEAYRRVRTQRERLALQRERDELVPRAVSRQIMELAALHIRRASERLEARFGREAWEILDSALQAYEDQARRFDENLAKERPDEAEERKTHDDPSD